MSIPPLVCSTPPPPEQCEDDKDQEDFDMNYHLSQEDEEDGNEYDYGDFSTFNHFQCPTTKASQELGTSHKETNHEKSDDTCRENKEIHDIEVDANMKPVISEDDVLEDLNLEIDHEPTSSIQKAGEESETIISEEIKQLHSNIPISKETGTQETPQTFEKKNGDLDVANENSADKYTNSDLQLVPPPDKREKNSNEHDTTCDINTLENFITNKTVETVDMPHPHCSKENNTVHVQDTTEDDLDGFEDFDEFQFVASDKTPAEKVFDTASENPWQNNDDKNEGFGHFTANFEEVENTEIKQTDESFQVSHNSEDDFGDFDEFKSVNDVETSKNVSEVCKDVPVLNLHSTDSEYQIIERINQVMHTIFENEITESDNVLESKLDLSLGETWGYLRETDVRQPYIVNWNNSLAQKTLLKALCIDSRNILFGPKWSSNMPKYAANLSSAPLQPQKQAGQTSTSNSDIIHSEKSINKTWTDPFTSDGQESCHGERENTVIETGPTDLDVFEAAISTKPDKIYSNTLSIQPMRQINLPDTHIFTPTNSEIPRSKTIHYDSTSTPTVLMPQAVQDNNTTSQIPHTENDNDYWEFQDFKGSSDKKVLETNIPEELKGQVQDDNIVIKDVTNKSTLALATQVLQPIKLEPMIPTLNWPDPGEVKEVFDDFSDFISNLPASNEKQESSGQSMASNNVPYVYKKDDEFKGHESKSNKTEKVDDDFEMFQSALPPTKNVLDNGFVTADSHARDQASTSTMHNKLTDFDVVFSKVDKEKADNISLNTNPIENVLKNVDNSILLRSQPIPSTGIQTVNTSVLQPTLATPSLNKQSQQKTGQILQPLSLESYSQINWPNPGIDLQDLSRFNPVESLHSFKNDSNSQSKTASPVHNQKGITNNNHTSDEDIWGDFVSSKPKQQQVLPKKQTTFADDEEWTDFVSSPSVNSQNGLNTISLNVHTNSSMQKSSNTTKYPLKTNEMSLDIPALNYITPKSNKSFNERHFQNL